MARFAIFPALSMRPGGPAMALAALVLVLSSAVSLADQTDPQLTALYQSLRTAESSASADSIQSRIWQVWLTAPDAQSNLLLQATVDALGNRDLREALVNGTQLVEAYPNYAEGWNKRATVHYLMGNFDASVADIGETLRLEPRHFGAISGLGLIFRAKGDLQAALDAFSQVLQISPQSLSAQRSVAELKQQLGIEI